MNIRAMLLDDVAEVMRLELLAYPFPWSEGNLRDCLASGYQCWVMTADDESVDSHVSTGASEYLGYAVVSIAVEEAHLLNIVVSKSCQGQGLGRLLLRHIMDDASAKAQTMFLEVRESNASAIHLYETIGFSELCQRKGYYPSNKGREDALVMACPLID